MTIEDKLLLHPLGENTAIWSVHGLPIITLYHQAHSFGYLIDVAVIFTNNAFDLPLSDRGVAATFKLYTSSYNPAIFSLWRLCDRKHGFDEEGFDSAVLGFLQELEDEH